MWAGFALDEANGRGQYLLDNRGLECAAEGRGTSASLDTPSYRSKGDPMKWRRATVEWPLDAPVGGIGKLQQNRDVGYRAYGTLLHNFWQASVTSPPIAEAPD